MLFWWLTYRTGFHENLNFDARAYFILLFWWLSLSIRLSASLSPWVNPTDLFLLSLCVYAFRFHQPVLRRGFRKHIRVVRAQSLGNSALLETSAGKLFFICAHAAYWLWQKETNFLPAASHTNIYRRAESTPFFPHWLNNSGHKSRYLSQHEICLFLPLQWCTSQTGSPFNICTVRGQSLQISAAAECTNLASQKAANTSVCFEHQQQLSPVWHLFPAEIRGKEREKREREKRGRFTLLQKQPLRRLFIATM